MNKQTRKKSSQFRGVFFHTFKGMWRAQLQHEGRNHWGGDHETEIEAAAAYNDLARALGLTHQLNVIKETLPVRRVS